MPNRFQIKRTSTSGRTPNTTSSGNTQYIAAGELALNMADGILYTSNGSALIPVGANVVDQRVTGSLTLDNDKAIRFRTVNTAAVSYFIQQNDDNFVFYSTNTAYGPRPVWTVYANSTTSNLQIQIPLQPLSGIVANNSPGSAGQFLTSSGTGLYWSAATGTGTVTQVNTGIGLSGGPISTTGTVSVLANTGIVANATGLYVNSAYIGTISANAATYLNGKTEGNLNVNNSTTSSKLSTPDTRAVATTPETLAAPGIISDFKQNTTEGLSDGGTYFGELTFRPYGSTTDWSGGPSHQLAFTTNNNMYFRSGTSTTWGSWKKIIDSSTNSTLSGNIIFSANVTLNGLIANGAIGTAGQVLHSDGTKVYWAADDNAGGTVTSVATGNGMTGGTFTTTGTVSVLANTGIVANATGVYVNSAYIATISANAATYLNGKTEGNLNVNNATQLATTRTINGVNFNGTANILVPSLYDANYRRITNPGGAEYNPGTASVTGAIEIVLPVGWTNSMMRMTVKIYDYAANTSFDLICGGYNYVTSAAWINTFAYILADKDVDRRFTVRFGYNAAGKCVIYIGELAATWSYPQVYVTDVQVGHSGQSATWVSGWTIGAQATAFENVTSTVTSTQIGYGTSTSTADALVLRDASSNFAANTITANLIGNVTGTSNNALYLGGVLAASYVQNTDSRTLSGNLVFTANVTLNGLIANGAIGTAGQVLHSDGAKVYWAVDDQGVTSVASGNGITGGTITTTGTLYVTQGTGVVVNATGVHVNSAYIGTISANAATYLNGKTEGNLNVNSAARFTTARTLTIGSTGKSFDGTTNLSWTTTEIGAEYKAPDDVPRSNLGDPTVREMAVFDSQFTNKTELYDINNLFFETSTDNVNWSTYSVTDAQKRLFLSGDAGYSSITIPNGTAYFRVRMRATAYVYLNALYSYWSGNGHTTQVQVFKKHDSGSWTQHTSSTTAVGAWPGHLYLPFSTIPWHPSGTLGSHFHEVYILFIPAWNGTYPTNNIDLYKFQLWGGYPAGRRNIFSTNEYGVATFPANVVAGTFVGNVVGTSNNASYLGGTLAANYVQNTDSRTLSGNLVISGTYFNPSANTILLGNSTQRWVLSANSGDFSSTVNAVTSVNSALLTVGTAFIANTTGAYHTGTMNAASHTVGSSFIANSTAIVGTGFANITTSVNSALLTVGTAFIANTTGAYHTGTVNAASHTVGSNFIANSTAIVGTGFANITTSVNSALLTVGTSFIANTTGVYHTGTVNALSFTSGANVVANNTSLRVGSTTLTTTNAVFGGTISANGGIGTAKQALVSSAGANAYWATLDMTFLPDAAFKKSVRAATTADLGGVTATTTTLTASTLVALPAQDGITLVVGDRLLVKDQATPAQNGIYEVTNVGSAGVTAWILTRPADADAASEIASALVAADSGTTNGGRLFDTDFKTTDTLGTTSMVWHVNIDNGGGTFVGNIVMGTGSTGIYPTSNTVGVAFGNTIARWNIVANNADFSSTVNAVTSVNSALLTVGTAFIANTTGAYHTGTMNAASHTVGSAFIANSTAIVGTGYANITTSVNSALLTVGTAFIANTTGAYHTGTMNAASHTVGSSFIANSTAIVGTGFANITTSVNSALLTVGTAFIANTTGAYHTGVVNGASHTVGSNFIANSTAIVGTGYANITTSVNSALLTVGTAFIANTTGAYHTGLVNAAAFITTGNANAAVHYAGANVYMNATHVFVSTNSTMNTIITANQITLNGSNVMTTATTLKVYYSNGTLAFP